MVSPLDEPVLASWNVGLGQVVAFTSDASTWASGWLQWPGYQRMWTQIVRAASRPPLDSGVVATATMRGEELVVRASAIDKNGVPLTGLSVPATLYSPSGKAIELMLAPVGVGEYEVVTSVEETGSYVGLVRPSFVQVQAAADQRRLPATVVGAAMPRGSEYRALASNERLLEQIATITGGRVLSATKPGEVNVLSREGLTPAEAISPLTKQLLPWAIVLLLLDIAVRRVAWDRWVSKKLGAASVLSTERAAMNLQRQTLASVGASVEELKRASATVEQRVENAQQSAQGLVFSDVDARALASAARDKRRATRLAQAAASEGAAVPSAGSVKMQQESAEKSKVASDEPGGLLAAKRRANKKFE
jgi:hypothetical protein